MTIDEIITILEKMRNNYLEIERGCSKNLGCFHLIINALCQAVCLLKELNWYREQKLIRSEDAIEILTQMQWHDENGYPVEDYEDKKQYAKNWIEKIPKAEPPQENNQ